MPSSRGSSSSSGSLLKREKRTRTGSTEASEQAVSQDNSHEVGPRHLPRGSRPRFPDRDPWERLGALGDLAPTSTEDARKKHDLLHSAARKHGGICGSGRWMGPNGSHADLPRTPSGKRKPSTPVSSGSASCKVSGNGLDVARLVKVIFPLSQQSLVRIPSTCLAHDLHRTHFERISCVLSTPTYFSLRHDCI